MPWEDVPWAHRQDLQRRFSAPCVPYRRLLVLPDFLFLRRRSAGLVHEAAEALPHSTMTSDSDRRRAISVFARIHVPEPPAFKPDS